MSYKVELKKIIEIDGKIWYNVFYEGVFKRNFNENEQQQAIDYFYLLIENKNKGLPKTEIILAYDEDENMD